MKGASSSIDRPRPRAAHVIALVSVQVFAAAYHVLTKTALTVGVDAFVFCTVRDVVALGVLSAYVLLLKNTGYFPLQRTSGLCSDKGDS